MNMINDMHRIKIGWCDKRELGATLNRVLMKDISEKVTLNVKQEPMSKEYSRQRDSKYTDLKEKNKLVNSRKKQNPMLQSQWMRGREEWSRNGRQYFLRQEVLIFS